MGRYVVPAVLFALAFRRGALDNLGACKQTQIDAFG